MNLSIRLRQMAENVRPRSNNYIALFAVCLIAALTSACNAASAQPPTGETIVYVAVPLSGFRADAGQSALGGVRLAAAEINSNGGLLGRRIVVRALNDRSENNAALENAERIRLALAGGEHIAGLIGHLDSGPTSSALPLYEEMGIVQITPAAGMRALTHRGHTMFFRVNANDSTQAEAAARFLVHTMTAQRVAVVHSETDYGSSLAVSIVENLQGLGATTAIQLAVAEEQPDFSETAQQIQSAEADSIFFAGDASAAHDLRASLLEAKLNLPLLSGDGAFLAADVDQADPAAGAMYVSALAPNPFIVAGAGWIEAYRDTEYRDPGPFSVNGYIAMQVLAAGVRAADSFLGHEIAQAIRESESETLLGPLRFKANGDLVDASVWFYKVEDGEFRPIE